MKIRIQCLSGKARVYQAYVEDVDNFEGIAGEASKPYKAVTNLIALMNTRLPSWVVQLWAENIEIIRDYPTGGVIKEYEHVENSNGKHIAVANLTYKCKYCSIELQGEETARKHNCRSKELPMKIKIPLKTCQEYTENINWLKLKRDKVEYCSTEELGLTASIVMLMGMSARSKHEFKYRSDGIIRYKKYCIHCKRQKEFWYDET